LGSPNTAIIPGLKLAHTQNEGLVQGIETGAHLRGILRFTQILSGDNLKAEKERFMRDYLQMDNNGGIIVTDAKADYAPIEQKPYPIDAEQLQATRRKIYSYLGITEKIVESSYTESEYNAFYQSVVEPLAVQLSLEFTSKIFTDREQAFGNSIIFEANRLQFADVKTKSQLIERLIPVGLLTANEAREILNLPSIPDGDRRLVSLNYVHADVQDEYQLEE
jgi:HK97 family phage portal protein